MCTVTYFPLNEKIIFTSNRDEKPHRAAQMLFSEISNNTKVYFPKDAEKNGTWFVVSENGNTIVLLNGAFENHEKKTPYRKSRGLIVLDLIFDENLFSAVQNIDLQNIEPFTLILMEGKKIAEFRWSGSQKYFKFLDPDLPYIWSSATLYNQYAQEKRVQIFQQFLQKDTISQDEIWNFHHQKTDDLENGITIKRENTVQTISTTQVVISHDITIQHSDRLQHHQKIQKISLKNEFKI